MYGLFITFLLRYLGHHSSMPSPLAPDPIRVQPYFGVYSEPIEIAWR